jgi:hypothetical protein
VFVLVGHLCATDLQSSPQAKISNFILKRYNSGKSFCFACFLTLLVKCVFLCIVLNKVKNNVLWNISNAKQLLIFGKNLTFVAVCLSGAKR